MNLRHSARSFLRTPGISIDLLFTIALGIGSNIVIQGFILGLTKPALPLASIDRVVSVFGRDAHREAGPLSYEEYLSANGRSDVFEWLGVAHVSRSAVGQSATATVARVTPKLASLFSLPLDEGIVISHRIWLAELNAKSDVVGGQIQIDGVDYRIDGVAPEWLEGLYRDDPVDVWTPLQDSVLGRLDRNSRSLWVLGRLARGISASQAQIVIQPDSGSRALRLLNYTGITPEMAAGLARVGTLLGFAAWAVFFIACVNVALLLLGRAFKRGHETALRVALGGRRGQIVRELLSDSVVISLAGGASGMLLALWTSRVLPALLYEKDAESLVFAPDLFRMAAAAVICVAITIACGLLPVVAIPHDRPVTVLRRENAGPSPAIRRVRFGLVAAQMASCCILVVATACLLEGLRTALATSAGYRLGNTLLAGVKANDDGIRYFQRVEKAVKSIGGISGISWAGRPPGTQPAWQPFRIEPAQSPLRDVTLDVGWLTAGSLDLFNLPPRAGRMFGLAEQGCRAAIVNEEAAANLFGVSTAGRVLRNPANQPVEIIGVVAMRTRSRPTIFYDHTNRYAPPPGQIAGAHFRAPIVTELASVELDANIVSPDYFDAMGIKLIAGQDFRNSTSTECRIGIVNREADDLFFGGRAIGAAAIDERGRRTEIIGVVHSAPLGTFQRRVEPAIYFPMSQDSLPRMTMIVQARARNRLVPAELRRKIESVAGHSPPLIIKTLDTHLTQTSLAPLHIATMILTASATIGFLLSVLGLFGALSDAARQRRRELAVRIALGAQRWRVIRQVLAEGGRLACAGTLAGVAGSVMISHWMAGITGARGLPAVWVWLTAPIVLAGAVAIASVLPARRALMVNPLMIMREDN